MFSQERNTHTISVDALGSKNKKHLQLLWNRGEAVEEEVTAVCPVNTRVTRAKEAEVQECEHICQDR